MFTFADGDEMAEHSIRRDSGADSLYLD
jgi:hypothetical protein